VSAQDEPAMADERRSCPACGATLNPEPDLRVQFRESQRDATGKPRLQSAAVLGRFKCPGCGRWSEHALWEVSTQGTRRAQHGDTSGNSVCEGTCSVTVRVPTAGESERGRLMQPGLPERQARPIWHEFVDQQALLAVPRHPTWDEHAWAEYAYIVACGARDVFHLTEEEREQAENLFYRTTVSPRFGQWAGLN
jgi:hypothetical protein